MTSLVFGAATPSIGERNGGLAQSNTSDDTLPTVLDGVNNCVRRLVENVLYKRNKTPMCGPMARSPTCQVT